MAYIWCGCLYVVAVSWTPFWSINIASSVSELCVSVCMCVYVCVCV
jgi:hypothetical protein